MTEKNVSTSKRREKIAKKAKSKSKRESRRSALEKLPSSVHELVFAQLAVGDLLALACTSSRLRRRVARSSVWPVLVSRIAVFDGIQVHTLREGTLANQLRSEGNTPMQLAAAAWTLERELRLCISANSELANARGLKRSGSTYDEYYSKLLLTAAERAHRRAFVLALAQLRSGSSVALKALLLAAHNGHAEILKLLLDSGCKASFHDKRGRTPLHYARNSACAYALLRAGASPLAQDDGGNTPMHAAARHGYLEVVRALLDTGTINSRTNAEQTPLHEALRGGHADVARYLLQAGASCALADRNGLLPVHLAAELGDVELISLCAHSSSSSSQSSPQSMRRGVLELCDASGNSPLDHAIAAGQISAAVELLHVAGMLVDAEQVRSLASHKLGSGGFGEVYLVEFRDSPSALKVVRYDKLSDAGKSDAWIMEKFVLEVALMHKLSSHPSFVRLLAFCLDKRSHYLALLTEYMVGGSLYDKIHFNKGARTLPSVNAIAHAIALGMEHLHSLQPQIIHRDLTTQNILLDIDGNPRIADFGISRFKKQVPARK